MIFDQADIIQRILFHVAFAPSPLANGSWPTRRKDSCQKAQHWLDDPEAEKSLPWEWLNWEDVRKSILVNRTFYSEGSRLLWRWLRFGVHHERKWLLASALLQYPPVGTLESSLEVQAPTLPYASFIRSLSLCNLITNAHEMQVLAKMHHLRSLDLLCLMGFSSDCLVSIVKQWRDNLHARGRRSQLQQISLLGGQPSLCCDATVHAFVELAGSSLRVLRLIGQDATAVWPDSWTGTTSPSDCLSEHAFQSICKGAPTLTSFMVTNLYLSGKTDLAPSLARLVHLQDLCFTRLFYDETSEESSFQCGEDIFYQLADAIHSSLTLKKLALVQPRLPQTNRAIRAFTLGPQYPAKPSSSAKSIQVLDLSQSDITDDIVRDILLSYPKLEVLDLTYCHRITSRVVSALAERAKQWPNETLRHINLHGCMNVDPNDVRQIIESRWSMHGRAFHINLIGPGFLLGLH